MAPNLAEDAQSARFDPPTMIIPSLQETDEEVPGSPKSSCNGSIRSSSEHSDTSTLNYDQESYESFKPRVEKLCQILWPPEKSIRQSFSDSKAATRMSSNILLRLFVPSKKAPQIERLRGGDYNRIVGISLPFSKSDEIRICALILRVPRWDHGQTERVAATLTYLRQNTQIPIATIVAKDFSNDNPLESPYIVQHRIPGSDLETLWTGLNHSQRCTVARKVGGVIKSLLALQSSVTGYVEASSKDTGIGEFHTIVPFDLKNASGDLFEESEQHTSLIRGTPRESQSTLDFFRCQIGRWRAVDVARNPLMINRIVGLWDGMLQIIEEMNDVDIFIQKRHCLCHVDLQPRNIMAIIRPNGSIRVTGILDWDEAVIAPKFMSCEPPSWLWGFDPDNRPHNDLPTWPYEISGANDMPSTWQKHEIKRTFEQYAGTEYLSLAYDEHFRICRCLFRIALFGLTSSENFNAADRAIHDWEMLRQSSTRYVRAKGKGVNSMEL